MRVDNASLPLNHFVQETYANMMIGFIKTLKESPEAPVSMEIRIKRLPKQVDVDAHSYP
jgi:hypothetical protein